MKDYMLVHFKRSEIGYIEKQERILFAELNGILNANYIIEGETVKAYYAVSGYKTLKDLSNIGPMEAVEILGGTLETIFDLSNNLIWPDEYIVNENTVYVSKNSSVKIAYIPDRNRIDLKTKINKIYEIIFEKTNLSGKEYLEIMMREIYERKVNSKEKITKLINSIKGEINIYGIDKNG